MIKKITVFCGSKTGQPIYRHVAEELIDVMHESGMTLIYGGAKVGLMGIIADHMLKKGGEVIGVIPQALREIEIMHNELTELHVVNSMHERKQLLIAKADAFIMLPGGMGSLDEFFEVITLAQLGLHPKPCGILNAHGYYDHILKFLDHAVAEGFLHATHRQLVIVEESARSLLQQLKNYKAPAEKKWMLAG